jgi:hypothetical protein
MTSPRNAPCPCGSGKKYKSCCLPSDQHAATARRSAPFRAALEHGVWQADVLPMPVSYEKQPRARPTATFVVGGEVVLGIDADVEPLGELAEIAQRLERSVRRAVEAAGGSPEILQVRWPEIAASMGERLADLAIRVEPVASLAELEVPARAMIREVAHFPGWPPVSNPDSWHAWGLPVRTIAGLFDALATFHDTAPWRWTDGDPIVCTLPDGARWYASVMGSGGEEYGLVLTAELKDYELLATGLISALGWFEGRVISVGYAEADEQPRKVRREIASAGWRVAAPHAFPVLIPMNTPAGGISRRDADGMISILEAISAYTGQRDDFLARQEGAAHGWTDPRTGVVVREQTAVAPVWPVPDRLAPAGATGPGARTDFALPLTAGMFGFEAEERERIRRFEESLRDEGLAYSTIRKHASNAALWIEFLVNVSGVPSGAASEEDLRVFLYGWYAEHERSDSQGTSMLGSLRRFFDHIGAEAGIEYPWAAPLLADRAALTARIDSRRDCLDPGDWRGELGRDLWSRLLIPDARLGPRGEWRADPGPLEAALHFVLVRRWTTWRDALIREGIDRPDELRERLIERQREWERRPESITGRRTVIEAIRLERRRRG